MISRTDFESLKLQTLKHFWGYDYFREDQNEAINSVIEGKDALVLLPTGGGKSLCYQLPALLLEGTCIVISPLLALMKDQVQQLKKKGIEAEYLSAELDDFEAENIYHLCKEGLTKLLYVSPERLTNPIFLENIKEIKISFIAVDEAHCISEWGQDFRPSFQNIKDFKNSYKNISTIALTGTATHKVLQEIQKKLDLREPNLFQQSFVRNNIKIITDKISDKYQRILEFLKYNHQSGIIYTRTRKEAEELTEFLKKNTISNVDYFHAGLPTKEKNQKQKNWITSNHHVLVATNAFGMGIDKDNVRFVIHFSPSASVENYYQEIGRVGRDGNESFALLLWNEQELQNFDEILKNQIPNKTEFIKIITLLYSIFQIADMELPEKQFQIHIQNLRNLAKVSSAKIYNVLNFLHHQEIIYLNNMKSKSSIELKIQPEEIELLPKKEAHFLELLLRALPGFSSHKVLFNEEMLSNKIGANSSLIKERMKELNQNNLVEYIDGALTSVKFLQQRNQILIEGKFWKLFEQIQKNKLQKWEEMKYFIQNSSYCKMRMILSYFGEKNTKNCNQCSVCEEKKTGILGRDITSEIISVLSKKPSSVEEIAVMLHYYNKETILENIILLLDVGKVKMLNYRTYALS